MAEGARLLAGGGRQDGAVYPPTVLADLPSTAELHRGEAFGPVVTISSFATDDEAIDLANDTEYGLTYGIIAENATHGLKVARGIGTCVVHINDPSVGDEPQAPFGGIGASGYGRFGGRWGIEAFSNTRWVTIAGDQAHFPIRGSPTAARSVVCLAARRRSTRLALIGAGQAEKLPDRTISTAR
ncbi:aldehyde dehydrogenase family protein [Streptomyces sp. NPDC057101]|uniref:aldehyde dehydrogenase family protein n=1 Tax=Streptomyces sp. NPDC057101 TaxID=3346020 RepID=UPI00363C9844